MEIRSIEINFDSNVLKINGKQIVDKPVIAHLPGPDGWGISKLFNPELLIAEIPKDCDSIKIRYSDASCKINRNKL